MKVIGKLRNQLTQIIFFFSFLLCAREVVILRVMENLCDAMTKYNIRANHPFRYKRGGKVENISITSFLQPSTYDPF